MSRRLTDVTVGLIKTGTPRRPRQQPPPEVAVSAGPQPTAFQPTGDLSIIQLLQQIPELQPFLIPDLVPDLIYLLQSEGVESLITELYPVPRPPPDQNDIAPPAPPDPQAVANRKRQAVVREAFHRGGIPGATLEIAFPEREPTATEFTETAETRARLAEEIRARGVRGLTALARQADPQTPASIIFNHPSQDVHRSTQKVEIELIKNEPDITDERTVIQCACGSGRVRTVTVQTRSADEPSTIFAQCAKCKRRWQQSAA